MGLLSWGAWVDGIGRLRSDGNHVADTAPISSFAHRAPNTVDERRPASALSCHKLPGIRVQTSFRGEGLTSGHWQVI